MTKSVPQTWFFIEADEGDYAFNMAMDEALLESMPRIGKPVLRFYGWREKAASFGYFQKYADMEKMTLLRPLVRRPTAGGLVPHDADWTYSLAFPNSHEWYSLSATESYCRAHEWIRRAFASMNITTELAPSCRKAELGQCFSGYEKYDLLWKGQKVAGAAQRRKREGLLIQGSVQPPPLSIARQSWEKAMRQRAECERVVEWEDLKPDQQLKERALELAEKKYSRDEYNQRR